MAEKEYQRRQLGRRRVLQASLVGGAGIAATAVLGCGQGSRPATVSAPSAQPKRGGMVTLWHDPPKVFNTGLDPHIQQSSFSGRMTMFYQTLVRLNPRTFEVESELAQRWEQKRADTLFRQAVAFEPGYYYFYLAQANRLLPQWYGRPGDSEQFAWDMARQIGGQQGSLVYFHIASQIQCCRVATPLESASWEEIKRGFGALEQLYGTSLHERNVLAYFAIRARDKGVAQEQFTRLGDNWDHTVWPSRDFYDRARTAR